MSSLKEDFVDFKNKFKKYYYPIFSLLICIGILASACGLPGDPIDETYVQTGYFDQLFVGGVPVGGGGATTFIALTDTPAAYAGHALEYVRVNAATNALEFVVLNPGDVFGPGASTDNALARWNGVGGDTLQNSGVTVDDNTQLTITNNGVLTTLLGRAGDYNRIGDANTTSHSFNTEDDLVVTGKLETNGVAYFDVSANLPDGIPARFGSSGDTSILFDITDANANLIKISPSAGAGNNVPIIPVVPGESGYDFGLFDGLTQPAFSVIDKYRRYTSSTTASSAAAGTTMTKVGAFTNSVVGDIVRVTGGTNATAGWYWIDTVTDADNIELDRNWCTGAVPADGVFVAYHSFTMLSAEGICTDISDGTPTDASVEIDRDGWLILDVSTNQLYARTNTEWRVVGSICPSGATVPTTSVEGEWYLHTPTGRNILMQYDGSNWINIASIGTMTMYVDKTDGTDGMNYGGAVDAGAFATVQYAVDRIPGQVNGNVTININAEDYNETVTIRGKGFTGNYTITLQGTLSVDTSGTQSNNGVQGTGSTQGSFTDAGNLAGVADKLCYLDADGDYRIIDSTDGNTATIVGTFTSQPLINENYVVYDWGTTLNGITVTSGQKNVHCYDIKFDTAYGVLVHTGASAQIYRCHINSMYVYIGAYGYFHTCYIYHTSIAGNVSDAGIATFVQCKFLVSTASDICLRAWNSGSITITAGCVFDCSSQASTVGIIVFLNGGCNMYQVASSGYNRIRNCETGVYAYGGGQVTYTSNNQYSGNVVDETATAASYGYID